MCSFQLFLKLLVRKKYISKVTSIFDLGFFAKLLDAFSVSLHNHRIWDILLVCWKAPSAPWLKVNTHGSVIGTLAACGGLFRDHRGIFLGAFACNIGISSFQRWNSWFYPCFGVCCPKRMETRLVREQFH